jgi:hypothetical protein
LLEDDEGRKRNEKLSVRRKGREREREKEKQNKILIRR